MTAGAGDDPLARESRYGLDGKWDITTANFDFIQHYRPLQNVVKRPTEPSNKGGASGSKGYAITGHHEILFPLVAAALISGWPRSPSLALKKKKAASKSK